MIVFVYFVFVAVQCSAVWKAYLRHNLAPLGGIVTPVTLSANLATTDLLITIIVDINIIIIIMNNVDNSAVTLMSVTAML